MWLQNAPFAVSWEVTRIALHCGVDLSRVELCYSPEWEDQDRLRKVLWTHPDFAGRPFPEKATAESWKAGLGYLRSAMQIAVFTAIVDYSKSEKEPLYFLRLQPVHLDRPTRLSRRFGYDRFLELLFPSPADTSAGSPAALKNEDLKSEILRWLVLMRHSFLGREWAVFFTKDAGYKKPQTRMTLGPEPAQVSKERVYMFAEDGFGFGTRPGTRPRRVGRGAAKPSQRLHQPALHAGLVAAI